MKEMIWRDGDHMLFESGCDAFDHQVDCISTGNVIGAVQYSKYIRPYTETSCGPRDRKPGFFRDYDLAWWEDLVSLPYTVRNFVTDMTANTSVILYEFHHHLRDERVTHGFVVTTDDHQLLRKFVTGPTYESEYVIDEAVKYIVA